MQPKLPNETWAEYWMRLMARINHRPDFDVTAMSRLAMNDNSWQTGGAA